MPRNPFDLTGKVTLVTGANSGLGLAFATAIADAGGDVVIWGRRADRNVAAAATIAERGVRVHHQVVDVADETRVGDAVAEAVSIMGRIDCVVVNAGISTPQQSFVDMPSDAYHELLAINQHGAYYTLREVVRHMAERAANGDPGGSLIVNGSLAVVVGIPRLEHYAAAKGALAAMSRSIAVEYGHLGIRSNMILPGRIATDLAGGKSETEMEALDAMMRERNPIPRYGRPEDLCGIVVYLASDASTYHTGDLITVDGGLSVSI